MDSKPAMLKLISSSVSIIGTASAQIRKIIKTGQLGVVDKGVEDYQTEGDRQAQRIIVSSLAKRFPKCRIVGEEHLEEDKVADASLIDLTYDEEVLKLTLPHEYINVKEDDITVWVDPIDGTSDFVRGQLEHVTVLIGISINGKAVAGIISQPFYGFASGVQNPPGRIFWGLVGLGCFGISSKEKKSDDGLVIITTSSHWNSSIEESIVAINPVNVLRKGGAGYKVISVIEGQAHSYVFSSGGCKRWDTCAPEGLIKSSGGTLTDVFGNDIEYNYREDGKYENYLGVIATSDQQIHKKIIDLIPEKVKRHLKEKQTLSLNSRY